MVAWKHNATLDDALTTAAQHAGATFRQRLAIRMCLLLPRKRRELELAMTEAAMEAGAIPPQGDLVQDGCYVGSWQDLLDWIIANWPKILEMILAIISLF